MVPIFKLIVTDDADNDLAKVIRHFSDKNAQRFSEELFQKYENIKFMPKLYQRLYYEKKTKTDYRRIVHRKYIIVYKIHKNQITILRIVSEKENYLKSKLFKSFI
ncbi:MAG: type II toxin-antitoxin system RelE/ParE family toxin [Clostridia bacterium]|nr:type II toxin-antitoxin system RelE/ParE family toxin [Clostridia bacterium]